MVGGGEEGGGTALVTLLREKTHCAVDYKMPDHALEFLN